MSPAERKMLGTLQRIAAAADAMEPSVGFGFATSLARLTLNDVQQMHAHDDNPPSSVREALDAFVAALGAQLQNDCRVIEPELEAALQQLHAAVEAASRQGDDP